MTFFNFDLQCSPEGTYVKDGDKIISFARARDNRCPPVDSSVRRESIDVEALVVGFVGVVLSEGL